MASTDEELVRIAFAHWNRGDWEATLQYLDPDVEWRTSAPLLDLPPVSRGHAAVRAFWQQWTESWTDIRIDAEDFIGAGDEVLVLVRWRARSQAGIDVDQPVAFRFLLRDGLVVRFTSYWERSEAFEALGLPARS
jgi:ketosteroid isomerase-like protein